MDLQNKNNSFLNENFEYFFEHSLCGFLITDPQGSILKTNAKLASWIECSASGLEGKKMSNLLATAANIYYETHLLPLLKLQGYFDETIIEIKSFSGQKIRILLNAVECRDNDNKVCFIHYTLIKASDHLLNEQNLTLAKTTAEKDLLTQTETVGLREQLIAVLGHDLRNPLFSITIAAELLEAAGLDAGNAEILQILKRSASRMAELISNVMDFARTRLGEGIVLNRSDVILTPVLRQVVDELKTIYPQREIFTEFVIIEPVNCDPDRLGQLLSNLIANALTHGKSNTPIYVRAMHNDKALELSVSNSGEPIPQALHAFLFQPFTREENRPSQNGLGLGLYISSEIARSHHATLICTSNEEETRFTFRMLN